MVLRLAGTVQQKIVNDLIISGSKSESNRLLILQQLFSNLTIENLSDSDDTHHLQHALTTADTTIDIGHAGTAMRFLTAFFATQENRTVVLTGSERMQNRPIAILVDALRSLGATISYEAKEGYPPIRITGKKLTVDHVQIDGNVSSQYISALLLIAAGLEKGLTLELIGKITSVPYINMTLNLLQQLGIETHFEGQTIQVQPKVTTDPKTIVVESDWSSASYFYSIIALSDMGSELQLTAYKKDSLQGDSCLADIYTAFGVQTTYKENTIVLTKVAAPTTTTINLDLKNAPDIAQTIAVTCFGLGMTCELYGLHTLKIKETDRLEALREELTKLGATITVTNESLHLQARTEIQSEVAIATYNDHRMAMAFAPLALRVPIRILDAQVVTKSYRAFWKDLEKIGFLQEEIK